LKEQDEVKQGTSSESTEIEYGKKLTRERQRADLRQQVNHGAFLQSACAITFHGTILRIAAEFACKDFSSSTTNLPL
jgi:hypothetical protein